MNPLGLLDILRGIFPTGQNIAYGQGDYIIQDPMTYDAMRRAGLAGFSSPLYGLQGGGMPQQTAQELGQVGPTLNTLWSRYAPLLGLLAPLSGGQGLFNNLMRATRLSTTYNAMPGMDQQQGQQQEPHNSFTQQELQRYR